MANLNIQVDEQLYQESKQIFETLGLDFNTAIVLFLKQTVREQGIPFKLTLENPESIQARKDVENGHLATFNSLDELLEDLKAD